MTMHFGARLRKPENELKMTKENYAGLDNISSFGKDEIYSESYCKRLYDNAIKNYDININRFFSLNKIDFENILKLYIKEHDQFTEVFDLNKYLGVSGYYILVLDEYSQVYIGQTDDIKRRIMNHWSKRMPLDRLIFAGGVENSILSIDSFRALDTTRIFAYVTNNNQEYEHRFIMEYPFEYRLNRVYGKILKERNNKC